MMNDKRDGDAARDRGNEGPAAELMLRYCRGDREAFDGFYAQVAPPLLAELVAWTGDRRRAELLLDRTFRTLHEHRCAYVAGADPRPWLSRLARREFLVDRRRQGGAAHRPLWTRVRSVFTRAVAARVEAR